VQKPHTKYGSPVAYGCVFDSAALSRRWLPRQVSLQRNELNTLTYTCLAELPKANGYTQHCDMQ